MTKAPGGLFVVSAPSGGGKTSITRTSIERLRKLGIRAEARTAQLQTLRPTPAR